MREVEMEIRNHIYKFEVDNKETGKYIKRLRKEKGWTAEVLAEKLYCSPKTVSSWETGVRMPSLDMLVYLSELFGVSVHSLLLPMDNCSCEEIGYYPKKDYAQLDLEFGFETATDEKISQVFKRKEYLLQRLMSNVYTPQNYGELKAIDIILKNVETGSFILPKLVCGDYLELEIAWYKKLVEDLYSIFETRRKNKYDIFPFLSYYCILDRMYNEETMDKTISAMSFIEKSIIFSVLTSFKNTRHLKTTKKLFDSGALFIRNVIKTAPDFIRECIIRERAYAKIESFEESKAKMTKKFELSEYYKVFEYVSIEILELNTLTIKENFLERNNLNFTQYANELIALGEING